MSLQLHQLVVIQVFTVFRQLDTPVVLCADFTQLAELDSTPIISSVFTYMAHFLQGLLLEPYNVVSFLFQPTDKVHHSGTDIVLRLVDLGVRYFFTIEIFYIHDRYIGLRFFLPSLRRLALDLALLNVGAAVVS